MTHSGGTILRAERTWISVAQAGALIIVVLTGRAWLDVRFDGQREALARLEMEVISLQHELHLTRERMGDRWTASNMRVFELMLQQQNPELSVPDTHKIRLQGEQ